MILPDCSNRTRIRSARTADVTTAEKRVHKSRGKDQAGDLSTADAYTPA